MKQVFLWGFVALLFSACSGKCKDSSACDGGASDSTAHAMAVAEGENIIYEYEGVIEEDGVDTDYFLVIQSLSPLGDGSYELTTSYVDPATGEMLSFTDEGQKLTVVGIPGDSTVVIYQLVSAENGTKRNFRAEGDSVLHKVGDDFKQNVNRVKQKLTRKNV